MTMAISNQLKSIKKLVLNHDLISNLIYLIYIMPASGVMVKNKSNGDSQNF